MPANDFDAMITALDRYVAEQEQAAREGLEAGAAAMTQSLKFTQAHGDQTGATRAGYVAYVAGDDEAFDAAYEAADALNPEHSFEGEIASAPDGVLRVIATSPTDYQKRLEKDDGGAKATLGPTMDGEGRDLYLSALESLKARH